MVEIFDLDPEAAIWLRDKSPSEWSKSHFSEDVKCDTLVNNICECFNSKILDARDKMQANRDNSAKWSSDDIYPRIKNNYELIEASITDIWAVNLLNRKCSYRKWNLTRLPCKHVIAAIWAKNDEISSYIDDGYKVENYRRIYEFSILPMNGQSMWLQHDNIPSLPLRVFGAVFMQFGANFWWLGAAVCAAIWCCFLGSFIDVMTDY
ncbi:hypothetical protein H5410_045385 [Solanum commersonii]|uniref:SWIM-type domain-containing protein n=1 Tax=Solanum commersonii TaxID=4109 RepID=A0A9J5XBG4_SOLCO|nr:hypothetical protein H5410_045385 [Solanum commersonii]